MGGGFLFVGASLLAKGVLPVASAPVLKNALSLKGEGTVRCGLVFLSQPAKAAVSG